MKISEVAWFYVLTVLSIVYATSKLEPPRSVILNGIVVDSYRRDVHIPPFGALSDRIGRKPMYIGGAVLSAALAFPVFWLRVYAASGLNIVPCVVLRATASLS